MSIDNKITSFFEKIYNLYKLRGSEDVNKSIGVDFYIKCVNDNCNPNKYFVGFFCPPKYRVCFLE